MRDEVFHVWAYLELEITESMMMVVQHTLPVLQELKRIGVRLSLDDFGAGYSSFHYLNNFQIDEIKIDQSFVRWIRRMPRL